MSFKLSPKRWMVERTIAWMMCNRRVRRAYGFLGADDRGARLRGDNPAVVKEAGQRSLVKTSQIPSQTKPRQECSTSRARLHLGS
jgi:hypothetical protein